MQTTVDAVVESYLRAKTLSRGTRNEYVSTLCPTRRRNPGRGVRAYVDGRLSEVE
jgi:hypothetical protein